MGYLKVSDDPAFSKAAAGRVLRREGFTIDQICGALGVSRRTVMRWTVPGRAERDRKAARALKERYRGTCLTCGGRTTGCNGPGKAPTECAACMAARLHDERYWTKERIVAAIQHWAATHDERPPIATDWIRAQTIDGYRFPAMGSVYGPRVSFAKWGDAIEEAGFPRPRGGPRGPIGPRGPRGPRVSTETLLQRIRDASKDGIAPSSTQVRGLHLALRKRGIPWTSACEMAGVTPRRPGRRPALVSAHRKEWCA